MILHEGASGEGAKLIENVSQRNNRRIKQTINMVTLQREGGHRVGNKISVTRPYYVV